MGLLLDLSGAGIEAGGVKRVKLVGCQTSSSLSNVLHLIYHRGDEL